MPGTPERVIVRPPERALGCHYSVGSMVFDDFVKAYAYWAEEGTKKVELIAHKLTGEPVARLFHPLGKWFYS